MASATVGGTSYYLNKHLVAKWDSLKDGNLAKKDEDRIYIVDGREGVGKSLWAIQQASYIDPTIIEGTLPRITYTPQTTLDAIRNTRSTKTHTKCIIFDEAFRGLSSRGAISKVNRKIVQALMEMRQNNLVMFIVTPSFYLLDKYPAVLRSSTLFHITKEKRSGARSFRIFNYKNKAMLYQLGMNKGWSYPVKTRFRDKFFNKYPGGKSFEQKYRRRKLQSIREMDEEEKKAGEEKYLRQRDILINILYERPNMSYTKVAKLIKSYGGQMDKSRVGQIVQRYHEKHKKSTNSSP